MPKEVQAKIIEQNQAGKLVEFYVNVSDLPGAVQFLSQNKTAVKQCLESNANILCSLFKLKPEIMQAQTDICQQLEYELGQLLKGNATADNKQSLHSPWQASGSQVAE